MVDLQLQIVVRYIGLILFILKKGLILGVFNKKKILDSSNEKAIFKGVLTVNAI